MSHEGVKLLLADSITPDDLKHYQTRYTQAMGRSGGASPKERFEYAIAMTRSRYSADQMRAINILEDLCVSGDPNAFRDYLYYIAIANTKLGHYARAKECAEKFLSVEPTNRQVLELKAFIDSKLFNDGMKSLAIVGGAAVVIGAVAAMAFGKK